MVSGGIVLGTRNRTINWGSGRNLLYVFIASPTLEGGSRTNFEDTSREPGVGNNIRTTGTVSLIVLKEKVVVWIIRRSRKGRNTNVWKAKGIWNLSGTINVSIFYVGRTVGTVMQVKTLVLWVEQHRPASISAPVTVFAVLVHGDVVTVNSVVIRVRIWRSIVTGNYWLRTEVLPSVGTLEKLVRVRDLGGGRRITTSSNIWRNRTPTPTRTILKDRSIKTTQVLF